MIASSKNTDDGIVSLNNQQPPRPQVDSELELANEVATDRDVLLENKVVLSHADYMPEGHTRQVMGPDPISGHRTTLYPFDINASEDAKRKMFDRLWKLQTGRGHTYENDTEQKQRVRRDATWKRCDAILQSCEAWTWAKDHALKLTLSRNLQGFSRHYAGADGACVGFVLQDMYDSAERAKGSWIADNAACVIPGFDRETVNNLVDYVFRKYG